MKLKLGFILTRSMVTKSITEDMEIKKEVITFKASLNKFVKTNPWRQSKDARTLLK